MDKKTYEIGGRKYSLKPFEDYTHNEEVRIKELLGIDDNNNSLNLNTKDNNSIFPLLLIPVDNAEGETDFNDMKNSQVYDVLTDWIAARIFFIQTTANYFEDLLRKKMPQNSNMTESMGHRELINPS